MTTHFVNILTWHNFLRKVPDQTIYIDGFLLKLLIYLRTGKVVLKHSGLIFLLLIVGRKILCI